MSEPASTTTPAVDATTAAEASAPSSATSTASTAEAPSKDYSSDAYEASLADEIERIKMGDRHDDSTTTTTDHFARSSNTSSTSTNDNDDDTSTSASIEEIIEKDPVKALAAKVRGNEFYARQQYPQAIDEYTTAITLCPSGSEATPEQHEQLSVYYSNRAACYLMQTNYEATISDCTDSLALHPNNPKPLSRRAKAYEKREEYTEAIEDLKALVALDPNDRDSVQALERCEKLLAEKNEKMKTEMLGKLKDFGNTILGKFGMSLDNFKAQQDPKTGSYNISFGK